jgi:hypothetical protein
MRSSLVLAVPLLLAGQPALAAGSSGSSALALAALVGAHSPDLYPRQKIELARLLDGHTTPPYPAGAKIEVRADSVGCRASDVDITLHDCTLSFGKRRASLGGRAAHELYATLIEAGVQSSGAAGSIYESVSHLACTVDPHVVAEKGGGGADCKFSPGP